MLNQTQLSGSSSLHGVIELSDEALADVDGAFIWFVVAAVVIVGVGIVVGVSIGRHLPC